MTQREALMANPLIKKAVIDGYFSIEMLLAFSFSELTSEVRRIERLRRDLAEAVCDVTIPEMKRFV